MRIEPGTEQDVILDLKPRDLAWWDEVGHAWRVEKEQIRVMVGGSSDNLPVEGTLTISSSGEFKP